jgi:hypothetical protein
VALAPPAAAEVVDVMVLSGISLPNSGFGVRCSYLVVARSADAPASPSEAGVSVVDYNQAAAFFPAEVIWDAGDPYFATQSFPLWMPTAPAEHAIMAYQSSAGGPVEIVQVKAASLVGSRMSHHT